MIRLGDEVYLVGSGRTGLCLTDPYDCNVYLVDGGGERALIDAGSGLGTDQIVRQVERSGFSVASIKYLFLTHAHADHCGGARSWQLAVEGLEVVASDPVAQAVRHADEDAMSLHGARAAGVYPEDYTVQPCPVDRVLSDGDSFRVGELTVDALVTPGHSAGHVAYVARSRSQTSLFTGDLLFAGGTVHLGTWNDTSVTELVGSLRRLRSLPVDGLFPGHGRPIARGAREHVEKANRCLDRLELPPRRSQDC